MTYALAASLQKAVYQALSNDAAVGLLVGDAIYDAPLIQETIEGTRDFITLGEETVRDGSTATSYGAQHDFQIDIHSNRDGYSAAKGIAAAVCDALLDADVTLERGMLVGLRFRGARARPGRLPDRRIISLTFRAVLEDSTTYTG